MAGRRPKVSVYYRTREGYWTTRWREHGRQYELGGHESQDAAEDVADEIRKRLRSGLPGIREARSVKDIITHWWDTYVTTGSVQEATRETYKTDARRILATIGDDDAATTAGRIRQWRDELASAYGARAANKAHTALSSAYERALEAHPPLAETNPCRGIRRLPETRQAIVFPTRTHIAYLEQTAPSPRDLAMLLLASRTGIRQSELFGLAWQNVRDGYIWISQISDRKRIVRGSTKTKRSERRVPLPPRTIAAVEQIRPPKARGLLFPSPTDPSRPMARHSAWRRIVWHRWRRAAAWHAATAGEPEPVWAELLEIDWKNLRHHAISRWASGGASVTQVSRWSGDSIATVDKHYAHLFDEDEADVMQAVD